MKAFPRQITFNNGISQGKWIDDGMELRDYFAAKAMQAMIGQCSGDNFDDFVIAEQAYQMADFMIKERGQNDRKR